MSLDPSTLQAAIYALLDANNIETDAHSVNVSMLPHDSAPIYIVLSNDTCARFLAVELTALTGRTLATDIVAWALSEVEALRIVTAAGRIVS